MAVSYNKDTDYQKLIEEAAKAGDLLAAAKYEQQRNAKITDMNNSGSNKWGANYTTKYAQYLDDDYTAKGSYFDADMSEADKSLIQTLQEAYNVYNSLGDRAGMDNTHAQAEAIRSNYGYSGGVDGSDYIKLQKSYGNGGFSYAAAPTYADKYQSQIDDLLNQILNREDFSYDVNKDPLYAQYAQQYLTEGQRSMKDTLGQIASRTGGMASSYGTTAAQQAGDYYASQLANKVPELYQLAYSMYLDDKESQVEDLGLLQNMSDTQYSRYRDTMSDWRDDRNFAYNVYRDDISDSQWQQSFDTANSQWQTSFDYSAAQDALSNSQYETQYAYEQALQKAETLAKYGDFSGYADLGYSTAQIAAMKKAYEADQAAAAAQSASDLSLSQAKAILKENPYNQTALEAYERLTGVSYTEGNDSLLSYDSENPTAASPAYTNLLAAIKRGAATVDEVMTAINSSLENGYMTYEEAVELMAYMGIG